MHKVWIPAADGARILRHDHYMESRVMIIIRLLALAFWVGAVLALSMDLWKMTDTGVFVPTALGTWWYNFDAESIATAQNLVERFIWAPLWNPAIVSLLRLPAWLVLGGFAVVLTVLSAMRRGRGVEARP